MGEIHTLRQPSLIAKNPYVLRINLGKHTPDSEVRAALASGDMGFLHSFTTGSAVDGASAKSGSAEARESWTCIAPFDACITQSDRC